jgi:hypothetical protein
MFFHKLYSDFLYDFTFDESYPCSLNSKSVAWFIYIFYPPLIADATILSFIGTKIVPLYNSSLWPKPKNVSDNSNFLLLVLF